MNRPRAPLIRRFRGPFLALSATVGGGTLGYMAIEGWLLNDAFYMMMITIGTVGFGEVHNLSTAGRNFTSLLIVVGIFCFSYTISVFTGLVVEGQLTHHWERRRMERRVEKLVDHYIGGATLAAIQRTGRLLAPPPDDLCLQPDDVLAIVGTDAQLRALERACEGQG